MNVISSADNARLKRVAALRHKKYRDRHGEFIAEGYRLCREFADADAWPLRFALVAASAAGQPRVQSLVADLERRGVDCALVDDARFARLAGTQSPQGTLLVAGQRNLALDDLALGGHALVVVLDGVGDPGNVGTIMRTAAAVGADALITVNGSADLYADKVVRAAMGAHVRLPCLADVDGGELLAFAERRGLTLFGAALDASAQQHWSADFRAGCAVAFGSEATGLSPQLLARSRHLYIPMAGGVQSLNVATAAAIVLYEALRQRR